MPLDVKLLDGALASELEVRGADLNDPLWSAKVLIEQPDLLYAVNVDYLKAGADFVITATYQATYAALQRRGIDTATANALFQKSVAIAKQARDDFWADPSNRINRDYPLLAASIGPYGAYLADGSEYRGNYGLTNEALYAFHRPRMHVLAEAGIDVFGFETIPDVNEARVLLEILSEFSEKKAWLSYSCKDSSHISDGTTFANAVAIVNANVQIMAVGMNCVPPNWVSPLLKSAQGKVDKPFVVYPNGTSGWDAQNNCWLPLQKGNELEALAVEWRDLGAIMIGGCCKTTPLTISKIKAALKPNSYSDRE